MSAPASGPAAVSFPLLENGLDFLASAVEHLRGDPSPRDLKYALLHLASGIELVLKERLRLHDPAQLYDRPAKFNQADFEAGNFYSANSAETVKRLITRAGVTIPEGAQTTLQLLREKRNRVEHFGLNDTEAAISSVTARILGFGLDFIAAELDDDGLSAEVTEELRGIREALPELQTFVSERWNEIRQDVDAATTAVVACAGCGEEAAIIDDGPRCRFCGYSAEAETGADDFAHAVVGASKYEAAHDGMPWVVSTCPECDRETLVDQGIAGGMNPAVRWTCFGCASEWDENRLAPCDICGEWTSSDPGEMSVCGSCFAARVRADD
jgi:hypothetical protein